MENWSELQIDKIRLSLKNSRDKDIRFFRVAEFERMISRMDKFSASCSECTSFKHEVTDVVSSIDKAINHPGKSRRQYDKLLDQISKHQIKQHQYFPPYHFNYRYSFYGIALGTLIGLLIGLLSNKLSIITSIGFVVGLLIGQYIGTKKDKEIRLQKKIL